jgi:hypothetical protein
VRARTDGFPALPGKDVRMDWSHMTNWGWTMMAVWTTLWIVLVALIVVVGLRWARMHERTSLPCDAESGSAGRRDPVA